jgi:hypothetical protein
MWLLALGEAALKGSFPPSPFPALQIEMADVTIAD